MKFQKTFTFLAMATAVVCMSCKGVISSDNGSENDSTAVDSTELKELVADTALNKATRFYAGISCEGVEMSSTDQKAWERYSKDIKTYIKRSMNTRMMVDSLARNDFKDFRDKVDYVFYPFSGADFMYPITIYPDADTYFLCGLEKPGSLISDNINTKYSHYEAYRTALATFFRASYFITKEMHGDFHNKELDGVCPVITMLMAVAGYDIISIEYKQFAADGSIVDGDAKSNVVEYKFFRPGTNHEQTLYYVSGNVANDAFDANMKAYLDKTLPKHKVGSYLKAASFLMHHAGFSTIRDFILNNSLAVVEDDSGIPYRFFTEKFDVTLYGKYKRPTNEFSSKCYQPDLEKLYHDNAASIYRLPFRIGYNYPSNWLVARRK